ncbi:hypothetical protein L1049_027810 [Liquidambar formosana]|uniref:J domain-containing protein n=1 Tax=Liquidambar formosana TaxID=63359 RepID=A0AAP0RI02_LIQFO
MECNKDEATRAKEISVNKLTEKDFSGAKKFALKAQNLYPGLEGLGPLLEILDVYISAEKRINGEVDWYGVLGVDPLADDDTIRKQYRRLALTLHPDKNKSVGAEGAFKILSEAWALLSDKSKRTAYDQKRNSRGIYQKVPTTNPPVPGGKNGFHNFTKSNNSNARNQQSATRPKPAAAPPHPSKPNTFWTVCNGCKMQYEYLRNYLNHTLLCPNCHEPFFAVEMQAPPTNGSTPWASYQQRQNSSSPTTNKNTYAPRTKPSSAPNVGQAGFSGVRSASASPSTAAQAARMPMEKQKRGREETQTAALKEEAIRRKIHASKGLGAGLATESSNPGSSSVHKGDRPMKKRRIEMTNQMAAGNGGVGMRSVPGFQKANCETERVNVFGSNRPNGTRELSQLEIRNILKEKAMKEIRKKLDEWSIAALSKTTDKEGREKEKETQKAAVNGVQADASKHIESVNNKDRIEAKKSSPAMSAVDSDTKGSEPLSMSVPDPDFHDFDKDRTERSFGDNQVWAAYDDDDGMPRYYAMIHSVVSLKPFKMRISWLNSKSNNELAPLSWVGSGFSKTSGDFRIGKYEVNNSLNSFSHKVKWTKGTRGIIRIYPRKGDVWALYRNWSPDWNELTPDDVIHKYDMVEVLEDYDEQQGVTVAPLVKVAGFKTVFHQHLDPREVRTIPREELFRFSHQVPSYLLTGQEAQNAPKGCRELDPAATPLELLQVITEVKEEEMVDAAENVKEDQFGSVKNAKEEELLENAKITKLKGPIEDAGKVEAEVMTAKEKETEDEERVGKTEQAKEETTLENGE